MAFDSQGKSAINPDRNKGPGSFLSEVAWRDFYTHVLAAFPRTSMGRPFHEKYANVVWETDGIQFEKWCKGQTGVPIVDAAMRQGATQGNLMLPVACMLVFDDFEQVGYTIGHE